MSIDSEEFRAALNHMVNMDDEHSALPMRHTEEKAHEAAMEFLQFVDNYCDKKIKEGKEPTAYYVKATGAFYLRDENIPTNFPVTKLFE